MTGRGGYEWVTKLMRGHRHDFTPSQISAVHEGASIELTGYVEALDTLQCPHSHEAAVVVQYKALGPGLASRAQGLTGLLSTFASRKFFERRDFLLRDATGSAYITVERGDDLREIHRLQMAEHGVLLRTSSKLIVAGDFVSVRGRVVSRSAQNPHRGTEYSCTVRAESIERVVRSPRRSRSAAPKHFGASYLLGAARCAHAASD